MTIEMFVEACEQDSDITKEARQRLAQSKEAGKLQRL